MRIAGLCLVIVLLSGNPADACGRGCHARRHAHRAPSPPVTYVAAPMRAVYPVYQASPTAYTSAYADPAAPVVASVPTPATAPAATPGVQPTYDYAAASGTRPAYYYTYDDSGKLIIQEWADWLFRGGRDAGMPRPPMPIIGYFRDR